jgi:hypothetical protein
MFHEEGFEELGYMHTPRSAVPSFTPRDLCDMSEAVSMSNFVICHVSTAPGLVESAIPC